jgi:hypothetical protein
MCLRPCGIETYSTSPPEYQRLKDFLMSKTPDVTLSCFISEDSSGKIVKDSEYLEGTLSLPESEWADFVQNLFGQAYQSSQTIYLEQIRVSLSPKFGPVAK